MQEEHTEAPVEPDRDLLITRNQVGLLYSQATVTLIFPVIAAIALGWLLWDVASRWILIAWASTAILFSAVRYVLLWSFHRREPHPEQAGRWLDLFSSSAFISGLIWGTAPIMLIPYQPDLLVEFTLYNGLTLIVICGLVAGALVSYSVCKWVLFYYSFPALVPPGLYLIALGDKYNGALGGYTLLYFIFVLLASLRMHAQYMHYFEMEIENDRLHARLAEFMAQSEPGD